MPATTALAASRIGPSNCFANFVANGATTFAMASLNAAVATRFTAPDTRDIYSVYVNFSSVATPGTVTLRIETIDATTGKPTGSLYDANATLAFTPTAGWQILTFASHPTTNLVAGNEYAILLITTSGGTTQTLRAYLSTTDCTVYPSALMTAADGTTRSNLATVGTAAPICTIVYSDGIEEVPSTLGYAATGTALDCYGIKAAGLKFVVPANETWSIEGVYLGALARTGTPNDLRVRILDSSNVAVAGTTRTVSKNSLLSIASRTAEIRFAAAVSITAGTYRVVFDDSAQTGTNTNKYTIPVVTLRSSAVGPSGLTSTSTADITAGPIVWTDDATVQNGVGLLFATDSASGGAAGMLFIPNLDGV